MFDRVVVQKVQPAYPQEVHQHLAPTSDHLRLLDELEQRAADRLLARVPLRSNLVQGEVVLLRRPERMDNLILLRCVVNGQEVRSEIPTPWDAVLLCEDHREYVAVLLEAVAQKLAVDLVLRNNAVHALLAGGSR